MFYIAPASLESFSVDTVPHFPRQKGIYCIPCGSGTKLSFYSIGCCTSSVWSNFILLE